MPRPAPAFRFPLFAVLLLGGAGAQTVPPTQTVPTAPTLTLADVLARAERQTGVVLAQTELRGARAELARVRADPLSNRVALLQAEQRAQLATAQAVRAPKVAQANLVGAYTGVLNAQAGLGVSRAALALSRRGVQVAQIRLNNGSGTRQDLQAAQNALADANRGAEAAAAGLALARQNLGDLVGAFGAVREPDALPPPPDAGTVARLLNQSPGLLQARQQIALAEAQLSVLDPLYTPRRQIDEAASGLDRARSALPGRVNGERAALQNLFDRAVGAWRTVTVRRAEREAAALALAVDRQRLQGGVISPLQLQHSELADSQASLALLQARNEYLGAYHALQAGGQSQ